MGCELGSLCWLYWLEIWLVENWGKWNIHSVQVTLRANCTEAHHELEGNRYFSAQSRATTRRNTATADSSNKVRTIPSNILRGTLRYLPLLEPLSAHQHAVAHVENCRFPPSIAALKPTRSFFPQMGLHYLCNCVLFFDPVLHLNVAFMWKG